MKNIGILGSGQVGMVLANGFLKHGYTVRIGSRDGKKVENWEGETGTIDDVAQTSELVVVAVKGDAAEEVVRSIASKITGKTVIDVTNPIDHTKQADNGVLHYFTTLEQSLLERLQSIAPDAHFVKAFNSIGNAYMVNPDFGVQKPSMFFCGNDETAKKEVADIITLFGFAPEDMGSAASARAIEPLCMLWCIPGFLKNDWAHAFALLHM